MTDIYLIKYLTYSRGECYDAETATNQIQAYNQFKARKPNAFAIRIKSKTGVWINHFIKESAA